MSMQDKTTYAIGPGLVVQDGKGGLIFVSQRPPAKKLRRIRLTDNETLILQGESSQADVWEVGSDYKPDHPTQKPVELAQTPLDQLHQARRDSIRPVRRFRTAFIVRRID